MILIILLLWDYTQKKVDNVEKNEALEKVIAMMKSGDLGDEYCPICFDVGNDPLVTKCGRVLLFYFRLFPILYLFNFFNLLFFYFLLTIWMK